MDFTQFRLSILPWSPCWGCNTLGIAIVTIHYGSFPSSPRRGQEGQENKERRNRKTQRVSAECHLLGLFPSGSFQGLRTTVQFTFQLTCPSKNPSAIFFSNEQVLFCDDMKSLTCAPRPLSPLQRHSLGVPGNEITFLY